MRRAALSALRQCKWRLIVPAAYWLGLPHEWVANRLKLKQPRTLHENPGHTSTTPALYSQPPRHSIYAAAMVRDTCRTLRSALGEEAAERYVDTLTHDAPEYEADIQWGRFLYNLEHRPIAGLAEGEALLKQYPLPRFRYSLYQQYNQAGNIRRTRELAERLDGTQPNMGRTRQLLRARERMLGEGFALPSRKSMSTRYRPVPGRVLYLLHNSLPYDSGGYAARTHGLVHALRGHGWDVECVTRLGYPSDIKRVGKWVPPVNHIDGIPYRRLRDTTGSYRRVDAERYMQRNADAVLSLARRRRPAVLHGVSNHINGLAAISVGRRLGIPSVYEVRGLWELTRLSRQPEFENSELHEMIVRLETQACREADRVIAITEALKELLVERGVASDKIDVVPNGVDITRFASAEGDGQAMRERWGIPAQAVVFGYIGSMPQYEGLDDLIQALARLHGAGHTHLYCLLVGDGDQIEGLRGQARRAGVADHAIFTGRVPHQEVTDYYAAMDIMVFPRKPQPVTEVVSPLKPFEAMALGKPVLASDVAALAEIVRDEDTGVLFRKGSIEHLGECMLRLANDTDLRHQIGKGGRAWVTENRDWRSLSQRISSIYSSLGENVDS